MCPNQSHDPLQSNSSQVTYTIISPIFQAKILGITLGEFFSLRPLISHQQILSTLFPSYTIHFSLFTSTTLIQGTINFYYANNF